MQPMKKQYVIQVSSACYDEIRSKLVALGNGGTIEERHHTRRIDMHDVVIVNVKDIATVIGNKPTGAM
jgi:hypothetical protein